MSFALKTIIKRTLTAACLGSVILATTSCSMFKGVEDPTEGWTADKLYVEARDNLNEGNYETARDYYQKLEARYPYGRYSQQAQVETAYSYFKEGEPQQAIAVCDRFLRQYPEHPLSPYALYIKGIATLDEDEGWMSYLTRQDLSKRDAQAARDAFDIFKELVLRFPNSRYARDARERMHELVEAQAKYEINTAKYYYVRDAYIAAINRAENVLLNFQTSPQAKSKILNLAIHGKLVPQDPNDEPAIELLKRINPDFTPCDNGHYTQLPEGWAICKMKQITSITNGKSQKNVETLNGIYPIYGSGGVIGRANQYLCIAGSTIIGRKGTINNPIFVEEHFWNVDTAFGLKANDAILDKYLYYFCLSFDFSKLDKSTAMPSLTKTSIGNVLIPIPPYKEQERIVAKIDMVLDTMNEILRAV